MSKKLYAGVGGAFLTGLFFVIGLWANYVVSGNALHLVTGSDSAVKAGSVLFTSLFVGLSGGHYLGGSFTDRGQYRAFFLGANTVLWGFLIGFIGYQITVGGNIIEPILYSAVLVLSGGSIFALHRARMVEDDSRLDEYIGLFSSKGTAIIVTATVVIRTAPDPAIASIGVVVLLVVGGLLWNSYGPKIRKYVEIVDEKIEDLRTAERAADQDPAQRIKRGR